jgi:hypothetical protein
LTKAAKERNLIEQQNFRAHIAQYTSSQIVNVDESAFNNKTAIRDYGYAMRGERANVCCVFVRGQRYTLEMAISDSGLVAYDVFEGAMDSEDFLTYLEETLVRTLSNKS